MNTGTCRKRRAKETSSYFGFDVRSTELERSHHDEDMKRKRETDEPEAVQRGKFERKLHRGLREAKKSAKKAKSFELQKLVKKLKGASSDTPDALERTSLLSQLDLLKGIDHERIALFALSSKLRKDKVLTRNRDFQAILGDSELTIDAKQLSPLETRLMCSKHLAKETQAIVASLRELLTPTIERPADDSNAINPTSSTQKFKSNTTAEKVNKRPASDLFAETQSDYAGSSSLFNGKHRRSLRASGASSEDDSDSDELEPQSVNPGELNDDTQEQDSLVESDEVYSKSFNTPTTESLFLPTLSVGFTRGNSDSDISDREADIADGTRRNRRGQRARRAIWEKKYGRNAKHLKNNAGGRRGQHREKSDRLSERGRTRDTHTELSRSTRPTWASPGASEPGLGRSTMTKRTSVHTRDERPLHPSWEAKRRQKEKQSASIIPAQGAHIKFNE